MIVMITIFLLVIFSNTMHQTSSLFSPIEKWIQAPDHIITKFYFPYEQCVINLTNIDYDYKKTLFKQPKCLHLIDEKFKNIHHRCQIGGKHQHHDRGICVGDNSINSIKKRANYCPPIKERLGLKKYWSHLNYNDEANKNGYAVKLIKELLKYSFEIIAFVGDSMAVQFAQRFACNCLRNDMKMDQFGGNFFGMPSTGCSSKIYNIPNEIDDIKKDQSVYLTVYKLYNNIGKINSKDENSIAGLNSTCGKDKVCRKEFIYASIYHKTIEQFKTGKNKWSNTIHLTMLPIIAKESWELKPFANAIYKIATIIGEYNSRILILSPMTQHFNSKNGMYNHSYFKSIERHINDGNNRFNSTPCMPLAKSLSDEHPDIKNFKKYMNEIDKNWMNLIGFFDITPHSLPWYDLHSELKSTGWSHDCTHHVFNPFMYDAICKKKNIY